MPKFFTSGRVGRVLGTGLIGPGDGQRGLRRGLRQIIYQELEKGRKASAAAKAAKEVK